ncbi:unnamed protein product [Gongylonema pulchrum]|uniref:Photolyase/cryptochrome alpha/beta domain-containing protein n=1 Tax=Gongylonema pulchrum TaxID=637853 RepID=A0A183ENJ4_9BILA|nr:unnamed protein product [Gongylonema pulchrum]
MGDYDDDKQVDDRLWIQRRRGSLILNRKKLDGTCTNTGNYFRGKHNDNDDDFIQPLRKSLIERNGKVARCINGEKGRDDETKADQVGEEDNRAELDERSNEQFQTKALITEAFIKGSGYSRFPPSLPKQDPGARSEEKRAPSLFGFSAYIDCYWHALLRASFVDVVLVHRKRGRYTPKLTDYRKEAKLLKKQNIRFCAIDVNTRFLEALAGIHESCRCIIMEITLTFNQCCFCLSRWLLQQTPEIVDQDHNYLKPMKIPAIIQSKSPRLPVDVQLTVHL